MPLIHAAEVYEKAASAEPEPDDAFANEPLRSITTLIADVLVATAFGLILGGIYTANGRGGWKYGLLCGVVGFAIFQLAPAIAVPPAVPGMEVAPLALRQTAWWVSAVSAAVGFILLAILPKLAKLAGVVFYLMPAAVFHCLSPLPAPTTQVHAVALIERSFVARTLGGMLVFWLILGAVSGHLFARQRNATSMRAAG